MNRFPLIPDRVRRETRGWGAFAAAAFLLLRLGVTSLHAGGMEPWWPIDRAQLLEISPVLSPDAPAEVLDWRIDVDDSTRPSGCSVHEYIRYKTYDPEKSASITRVSQTSSSFEGNQYNNVEMRARLILPNGSTREFGKEAVEERDLERNGGEKTWFTRVFGESGLDVKEKFLATSGVEPGSVLEFQFFRTWTAAAKS